MINSQRLVFNCAFHTPEAIAHFCQQQCMLPLCKQCIPIHHKQHLTMNTPPNIIDIGYIVDRVHNDITTQREMLQKKSSLLSKLERNAEEIHKTALKRLQGDRTQMIKQINNKFDKMSKGLLAGYEQRLIYIKHIQDKIDTLDKTLEILNGTFYKSKPMRTVIMWQSNQLGNIGLQFQVKLQKQLLAPYKVQLLDLDTNKMDQILNRLTTDRLIQSTSIIQLEQPNDYLQILSKVLDTDIDARNQSAKRRSSKKNHSQEKDNHMDFKTKKMIQVLGNVDSNVGKSWANRTGKVFDMKDQFD